MKSHRARAGALCLALMMMSEHSIAQSQLSQAEIYRAQARLFESNFLTRIPDGRIGQRTLDALRAWQLQAKRPQTAELTKKEFDQLMRFDPGKHAWEAISGSTDGTWIAVWGHRSGVEAAKKALAGCQKKSSRPDDCSYVSNSVDRSGPGWSAAVFCEQRGLFRKKGQMFLHNGLNRKSAMDQAFTAASTAKFRPSQCTLVKALNGDGQQ
ncbi:MAG: hypothetical protein E5Y02_27125 [Mesorhizobium sp.]|nr:MAG: hypothetical protein E5Y02_27125 [Mesorhizobium sp.]